MDIRELVGRRSDLGTFVVHLTRDGEEQNAKARLISILESGVIEARSMFGHAKRALDAKGVVAQSQKAVCFTETPLEYVHLLLADITGRQYQCKPYGIAITKKLARSSGINPVWYVDISQGSHEWLSNSINRLINRAIEEGPFDQSNIARLAPFIEQMGTHEGSPSAAPYRKGFWWEREWRHIGNYSLPSRMIVLCPESEIEEFKTVLEESQLAASFVDPRWGLEQIIAHLAGFPRESVELL